MQESSGARQEKRLQELAADPKAKKLISSDSCGYPAVDHLPEVLTGIGQSCKLTLCKVNHCCVPLRMTGLLNKLFGYRWSLYICRDGKQLHYTMHEHSVVRMLGYVIDYYKQHGNPQPPWSIWLNFNRTHSAFELRRDHFTSDGENLSRTLLSKIESIDPRYRVRGGEPVVIEAATNKRIPINRPIDLSNLQSYIDNCQDRNEEITFFRILDQVFGHDNSG